MYDMDVLQWNLMFYYLLLQIVSQMYYENFVLYDYIYYIICVPVSNWTMLTYKTKLFFFFFFGFEYRPLSNSEDSQLSNLVKMGM